MGEQEQVAKARELLAEIAEPDEYSNAIADAELVDVSSETTALQITRTLRAEDNQYGERAYPASTYTGNEHSDDIYPIEERFEHPPSAISRGSTEYMEHGVAPTECPHCDHGENTCGSCKGDGENPCPNCSDGKVTCSRCGGDSIISCGNCDGGKVHCKNCDGDGRVSCSRCDNGDIHCENCDGKGQISCSHCKGGEQRCDNCDATGRLQCPNNDCGSGWGVSDGEISCSTCGGDGDITQDCPNCSGSGKIRSDGERTECPGCSGKGDVTQPCPDCHGGTKECNSCHGQGDISCPNCSGGTYPCSACGGSGDESCAECTGGTYPCSACSGSGTESCSECSGGTNPCTECGASGTQQCPDCANGRVTCPTCDGDTMIPCSTCGADGLVTCTDCNGENRLVYAEAGNVTYRTSTEEELLSELGIDREQFNAGTVEATTTETTVDSETADRGNEWIEREEVEQKQMSTLRVKYAVSPDGEREEYVVHRIGGVVHVDERPESRLLQNLREREVEKKDELEAAFQSRREYLTDIVEQRLTDDDYQQKVEDRHEEFKQRDKRIQRQEKIEPILSSARWIVPVLGIVGALFYFGVL